MLRRPLGAILMDTRVPYSALVRSADAFVRGASPATPAYHAAPVLPEGGCAPAPLADAPPAFPRVLWLARATPPRKKAAPLLRHASFRAASAPTASSREPASTPIDIASAPVACPLSPTCPFFYVLT